MRHELFSFTFGMFWPVISLFRLFSLDIVAGACISSLFFAKILGVDLSPPTVTCLAMAVWLIYTVDHLLDGFRVGAGGAIRHFFHKKYRRFIFVAWTVCAFGCLMLSFQLPLITLKAGVVLSLLVLFYFLLEYQLRTRRLYHKELFGAFIYTAGIFLPAMSLHQSPLSFSIVVFILEFFLLAFINLLLFARMDMVYDKVYAFGSLPRSLSEHQFERLLKGLFILTGALILLGLFGGGG